MKLTRLVNAFSLLVLIFVCLSCASPLPNDRFRQLEIESSVELDDDVLLLTIKNPSHSPIRVFPISRNRLIRNALNGHRPLMLAALETKVVRIDVKDLALFVDDFKNQIRFPWSFGDSRMEILASDFHLPFPKDKSYTVIQGYNGSFSHVGASNRYALDFNLQVGDKICAAADGYVVGVIEGYQTGGSDRKLSPYANLITLYHPQANLYTEYVHLQHKGALVTVGDYVKAGDVIGIAGLTGFTSTPHLHFNVLAPTDTGLISFPVTFQEGYKGEDLHSGVTVNNANRHTLVTPDWAK